MQANLKFLLFKLKLKIQLFKEAKDAKNKATGVSTQKQEAADNGEERLLCETKFQDAETIIVDNLFNQQ